MYTKSQIADAVIKFIANDLLTDPDILTDKHLKFKLCMGKKALHENPELLDGFMSSPMIASIISKEDEEYDIDMLVKTMKNVLSGYDSYSIKIPGIPMFAPNDSCIKITGSDVDKIISYLVHEHDENANT